MENKASSIEDLPFLRWFFQKKHIFFFFIAIYITSFLFIFFANLPFSIDNFVLENIAKETLISDENILYIDKLETSHKLETYDIELPYFYRFQEEHYQKFQSNLALLNSISVLEKDSDFLSELKNRNILFSKEIINYFLERRSILYRYTNRINYLYEVFTSKYLIVDKIVPDRVKFSLIKTTGIENISTNLILFYPVEKDFLLDFVKRIFPNVPDIERSFYSEILHNFILPTAILDEKTRQDRLNEYLNEISIPKSYIFYKEIIIKKGEKVTPEKFSKISAFFDYKNQNFYRKIFVYFLLSLALFVFLVYRFFSFEKSHFQKMRNIIISGGSFILTNIFFYVSSLVYREYSGIELFLIIPFGILGSLLPIILLNSRLSFILLISYTFFSFFYPFFDSFTYINLLLLSLFTIYTSKLLRKRGDFFTLGLFLSMFQIIFLLVYYIMLNRSFFSLNFFINFIIAFGNGMLCSIFSLGILPFIENIFNIPTHFKLLELSNVSTSELLKKFRNEAQGSYNHSIMLGDMCEQAAEAVGIDPLLVKVGAYYHDIGKMVNPEYFIENQMGENRHNEIKISMSVSVIKSHVKLGVEIARKYRIPEEIIDFIREHHGQTKISYFYHQAVGLYGEENVNVSDFEYPGPKPKSKATAILMLADNIEATLRTYSQSAEKITTSIIEDVIDDITEKRIREGQFEECNITLNEINLIKEQFLKFLYSYYHKRVNYITNR